MEGRCWWRACGHNHLGCCKRPFAFFDPLPTLLTLSMILGIFFWESFFLRALLLCLPKALKPKKMAPYILLALGFGPFRRPRVFRGGILGISIKLLLGLCIPTMLWFYWTKKYCSFIAGLPKWLVICVTIVSFFGLIWAFRFNYLRNKEGLHKEFMTGQGTNR